MSELKERKLLTLDDFKGVDFSTSPMRVSSSRAVEMENFINVDGVNQKRPGWESLTALKGEINGIYEYEYGGEHSVLVHAGNFLYSLDYDTLIPRGGGFDVGKSIRSQFFFNDGKVFIICGEYVVYKGKDGGFARVSDMDEVYVPVTTRKPVLSSRKSSFVDISTDVVTFEMKGIIAEEKVNLLTRQRTNEFYHASDIYSLENATDSVWLRLDTHAKSGYPVQVKLPDFSVGNNEYSGLILESAVPDSNGNEYLIDDEGKKWGKLHYDNDLNDGIWDEIEIHYGVTYIEIYSVEAGKAADKDDPIRVTYFAKYDGDDPSFRIRDCTLGVLFGPDGSSDRLFLTGSSEQKNAVYYSAFRDFTYFPDENYVTPGNADNKVSGFLRLMDSTMAIFKDGVMNDANVYYLTGSLKEVYDEDGELIEGEAEFFVKMGGLGASCVSPYATANLAGDSLMLSDSGVYGVTLTDNISINARYTRERSFNINERLRRHKVLSEAVAAVYGNRYYLAVDGVCYIADPRFRFYRDQDMDQSFNYEWWYWTNVPARCFAIIGDRLWFGASDGMICAFKEDSYTDDIKRKIEFASMQVDVENDGVVYDENIDSLFEDSDEIIIANADNFYARLVTFSVGDDGECYTDGIVSLRMGDCVYAGYVRNGATSVLKKCYVGNIDLGRCTFGLYENERLSDTVALDNITSGADGERELYLDLNGRRLYVAEKGNTAEGYPCFKLRYCEEGSIVDIVSYDPDGTYDITLIQKTPVRAEWVTPYFDMGSNMYAKTLLRMTLCADSATGERVRFGYQTKQTSALRDNKGSSYMSLDNFSFNEFSMDTSFADSYTVKVNVRNFNYIRFRFVSDGKHNCAVNNFSALYKINQMNRGVR